MDWFEKLRVNSCGMLRRHSIHNFQWCLLHYESDISVLELFVNVVVVTSLVHLSFTFYCMSLVIIKCFCIQTNHKRWPIRAESLTVLTLAAVKTISFLWTSSLKSPLWKAKCPSMHKRGKKWPSWNLTWQFPYLIVLALSYYNEDRCTVSIVWGSVFRDQETDHPTLINLLKKWTY